VTQATLVNPVQKLHICRDPKDNMVLECCLAAKANFLLTGDKDLLNIENLPYKVNILLPQTFLKT
jgi:putative PIN family toxin of toxin-antitoxin system